MFSGKFNRKPGKAPPLQQLKSHVAIFGVWIAAIRVVPYLLHYFSGEKEEHELEF